MSLVFDDPANIRDLAAKLRNVCNSGKTRPFEWRQLQLERLVLLLEENRDELAAAHGRDLGTNPFDVFIGELDPCVNEARLALSNLADWMQDEDKSTPMLVQPATGVIKKEPYGAVLLISPWNYPIRLVLFPLIGALAAGNTVCIKPSEVAPNTAALLGKLIPRYLDSEAVQVVQGAVPVATCLLAQPWDYIFYTGNTAVGRVVMKAAAEHLTPVTLELGGKSPVIIDRSADLEVAAKRILLGKFRNAGQTCVAPDYVLVPADLLDEFVAHCCNNITQFFGADPQQSGDYSRVVNQRHTRRLKAALDQLGGKGIAVGGQVDESDCYVAPTVVVNPPVDSLIMTQEIFGPVLPVLAVKDTADAIAFVNARPKPLAAYIFSTDEAATEQMLTQTSSGGVTVNGVVFHIICPEMEFGGVGASGMGGYNGRHTFDTFTHRKAVLKKGTSADPPLLYPPYTATKKAVIGTVSRGLRLPSYAKLGLGAAGVTLAAKAVQLVAKL